MDVLVMVAIGVSPADHVAMSEVRIVGSPLL